ncbi:hypothetical protein BDV93DRAFT_513485 [Ceratobasidium sp. AG-I]|nr:hypothetical protein BDV93DRAFT_513485 [Ceratobasidium sp. AG-I]
MNRGNAGIAQDTPTWHVHPLHPWRRVGLRPGRNVEEIGNRQIQPGSWQGPPLVSPEEPPGLAVGFRRGQPCRPATIFLAAEHAVLGSRYAAATIATTVVATGLRAPINPTLTTWPWQATLRSCLPNTIANGMGQRNNHLMNNLLHNNNVLCAGGLGGLATLRSCLPNTVANRMGQRNNHLMNNLLHNNNVLGAGGLGGLDPLMNKQLQAVHRTARSQPFTATGKPCTLVQLDPARTPVDRLKLDLMPLRDLEMWMTRWREHLASARQRGRCLTTGGITRGGRHVHTREARHAQAQAQVVQAHAQAQV